MADSMDAAVERAATSEKSTVELSGGRMSARPSSRAAVAPSHIKALRLDEMARTRRLSVLGITLSMAAVAFAMLLPGDPTARWVLFAGLGSLWLSNVWLFAATSSVERYDRRILAVVWITSSLGCLTAGHYFGVFSPAAAATLLGIYFIALGESLPIALGVLVVSAGGWMVLGVLTTFGVVPDVAIVRVPFLGATEQVSALVLTEMLYLSAFLLARSSRRVTTLTVRELEQAVREVAQRDALLFEAQRDLQQALRVGDRGRYTDEVMGAYRLGVVIGRGAMGEVYDATHTTSGAPAAVKVLPAHSLHDDKLVRRFVREAEAIAALDTPHVVHILAASAADDVIPWLAMERLRGTDLAQLLRQERQLAPGVVASLIGQLARGVDAAAAAGIVHRDLKPQNLFRDERGDHAIWKILDFGISKLRETDGTLTQGNVVGTPVYMSPEQARGGAVDHTTDTYALAAVAYRALTGQLPFRGKDTPSILYSVVHDMPARPAALADLPPQLDAVLAVGLAKQPTLRFDSARALSDALAAAVRGTLDPAITARARQSLATHPWSVPD